MLPASLGLLRAVSPTGRALRAPLFPSGKRRLLAGLLPTIVPLTKRLPFPKGGARRPPPVAETGRSRRSPEGVEGRGQREALRSPGIPGQRSAGRYEDPSKARRTANELASAAGRLCRTEPANKKSRGNEVKIGERRGEKKGYSKQIAAKASIKKVGVAQPASRIKDKRPGGRAYGILDCGTPPVLWSSQGVVTNPCQPGLTSCDAEAGTSHRPFALRQSRTLP